MITKERLEELIKEQATIYYIINKTFIAGYSSISEIMSYKLNEPDYYIVDDNCLCLMKIQNNEEDYCVYAWKLQELFETKEDAEWELEFGNITRTETLKLPTWEDWQKVSKYGMYAMSFFDKEHHFCELQMLATIKVVKWGYGRTVEFENFVTEENYIKACRICKKLFLGEEV